MNNQFTWSNGREDEPINLCRPCDCGCDERDGYKGVGYLIGSDKEGNGFTVWIENEEVFQSISRVL